MRQFINIMLMIYTHFVAMLLKTEPMGRFAKWALFSSLPIALILMNFNSTQLRMKEVIESSFRIRTVLYLLSCVTFLLCILCTWNVFSIQDKIWEHIFYRWPQLMPIVPLTITGLLISNILVFIRDSVRRNKGLTL